MSAANRNLVKKLFPTIYSRGILDRLRNELCYRLSATKEYHWSLTKSDDPTTGSIEFVKFSSERKCLETNIEKFYRSEGFQVRRSGEGALEALNGERQYRIAIIEKAHSYQVRIYDSPILSLVEN